MYPLTLTDLDEATRSYLASIRGHSFPDVFVYREVMSCQKTHIVIIWSKTTNFKNKRWR